MTSRPSAALVRAGVVGVVALLLAVLLGRPALLLAGLPLLSWALVAQALRLVRASADGAGPAGRAAGGRPADGRAASGQAADVPAPTLRVGRRVLEEGATTSLTVTAAPGLLTAVTVPLPPDAHLAPRHGAVAGDGEATLRVTARRWGRIRLGPVHVMVADPLGAHRAQRVLPAADVQVLPSSSVLEGPVQVPTPIGISGAHLSRRRGDGTALSEVRPFRPGDRLHRLNWRITSRTGELHTNATFTEQDTEVLIVTDTTVDVAPAPWAGEDAPTSLDMTIRATTAIARHHLTAGDRVAVFDLGHLIGPVPAGSGPRQLRVLTAALSRAGRDDGAHRPVRRLRTVRPGTLTVVCTPLLGKDVLEQIGVLVAHGADVLVVDTLPPSIGDLSVLRGRPVAYEGSAPDRFWPEAWALRRQLRQRTVRELREAGVPVTAWEGPSSLAPVLLSLSAARSAPRRRRS